MSYIARADARPSLNGTSGKHVNVRNAVSLGSAAVGVMLFFAVPELGVGAAIAAAALGGVSALTALTRSKGRATPTHTTPTYNPPDTGKERRKGERRRAAVGQ